MRVGARDLLNKYGSAMAVAEALLKGELLSIDEPFVDEVVSTTVMTAAAAKLGLNMPTGGPQLPARHRPDSNRDIIR